MEGNPSQGGRIEARLGKCAGLKLYWDAELYEAENFSLVLDDALWQGSGLAENIRVSRGRLLNLELHEERFADGIKVLGLPPLQPGILSKAAKILLSANRLKEASIRCRYFRHGKLLAHPLLNVSGPPPKSIRLLTTVQRHYGNQSLLGRVKSNAMLPNLLARLDAEAWADDGLRLTPSGYVAEGIWSNILMERGEALYSPPLREGILEGTTRQLAFKQWRKKGLPIHEMPLTRADLYCADRVWLCSSRWGMLRVSEIDGRKIA